MFYGHLLSLTVTAIFVYLFFHYPWSVGIRKAAECYTRLEAYRYARHPRMLDDLAGDDEDPYPEVAKLDSRTHAPPPRGLMKADITRVFPAGSDPKKDALNLPGYVHCKEIGEYDALGKKNEENHPYESLKLNGPPARNGIDNKAFVPDVMVTTKF